MGTVVSWERACSDLAVCMGQGGHELGHAPLMKQKKRVSASVA